MGQPLWWRAYVLIVIALLFLASPLSSGAGKNPQVVLAPGERQWLSAPDREIRVGITVIPPQILLESETYKGLSLDYIHLLEQKLGHRFTLVPYPAWNDLMEAAKSRKIDVVFAAQKTPDRLKYLCFSDPYIELPNIILTRKNMQGGEDLHDLQGRSVAVSEGSAVHEYLQREYPGLVLRRVPDERVGLEKVSLGEVDAMVLEISRASYYIEKAGLLNLRVAGDANFLYQLRFAVRSDWPQLCSLINKGLAAISDQERRAIGKRWIFVAQPSIFANTTLRAVLVIGLPALLLAVTGVMAWIFLLRKSVRQRTAQLEKELADRRRIEDRLRIIADNTYDWEYWRAPGGGYVWISPAFETLTGYDVESFMGDGARRVVELIHPDDRSVWERHLQEDETMQGDTEELEIRIIKADGSIAWIGHTCKPIHGFDGAFLGRRGCNRDITLRRHALEELTRSEQHLAGLLSWKNSLLNVSAFGLLVVTENRIISEINKGFVDLFGCAPEEVVGRSVEILHVSQEKYREFGEHYWGGTARQGVVAAEWPLRRKNGETFWCSLSGSALDMQDLRKGVVWIIRDISERKQMEAVLRESELRFRTLFEQSIDAIAIMDGFPPSFRYVNPAFVELFGYCQEEVRGLVGDEIWSLVHPEDLPKVQSSLQRRMELQETSAFYEFRIVRRDGAIRWVETVGRRTRLGETIINMSIYRDITLRKKAEEDQRQLEMKLQQAQKMEAIGTLAGGIAHDFNNILGAILGYAEMARDASPEGSSAAHDIDKVIEAGKRAAALVKQILAFSRQSATDRTAMDPKFIVKETLKLLRPALPSTITIKERFEADGNPILADHTQIHQIVMNLCTNAFHAMEHTGGELEISLKACELSDEDLQEHPGVNPGKFVVLAVADTGPGIPPAIRQKIFDPYFTTKEVGKGTGMGLAIVHGIITGAGGFITCASEPGKGTVFQVFFPVISQALVSAEEQAMARVPAGKERILFIDDEEILVEMGKAMLERLGYRVTACTSSIEAVNIFLNDPDQFDAVVTDQTMPGMTGLDLARRMLMVRPDLPIVLCTGYSTLVNEEQAKGYGIRGFVMKPMSKREIAVQLRQVLA